MIQTRIMLADDHKIVRECVRALLQPETDMEVVGEVGNGLQVKEMVADLLPDVLVLDLMMPGLNGLEVIRQIRKSAPQVQIIVLSMHDDESYVMQALHNGAVGYVLKDASAENLVTAIRVTRAGARYLSPTLQERIPGSLSPESLEAMQDPYDKVTMREREVLQLAAEGHNNDEIALQLSISPRTAEVHRMRVLAKLHIHNQTSLVKYALRKGLISIENRDPIRLDKP